MSTTLVSIDHLLAYRCMNTDCGFYFTQSVGLGTFYCPCCKYTTKPLFDYYRLFGLNHDFSSGDLKNSYKYLSQKYHPDKSKKDYGDIFMIIRKGFDVLKDETERELYDHELHMFEQFLAGKPIDDEEQNTSRFLNGGLLTFLLGLILAGGYYYQTKDIYIPGFGFMLWATVLFLWKEKFVGIVRLVSEVSFIFLIGYLLFLEEWVVGLSLTVILMSYFIFKYVNLTKRTIRS